MQGTDVCDPMKWKEDLQKFESNNYSGSAELLEQYIGLLIYWLEKGELQSQKDRAALVNQVRKLQQVHRNLFVLVHFYNQVIRVINEDRENWTPLLQEFLRHYKEVWSDVTEKLASRALSFLDINQKTILTHSQSSAVKEVFRLFRGNRKKVNIIQTESRPAYEGRMQATLLGKLGYDITLLTDVGFTRHLDKVNMILLGADSVYRDYFVNKAGSYAICLSGKNAGIPVYVLADSRKFWSILPAQRQETGYVESGKPAAEVWEDPPDGIQVENLYFERTPSAWVDGFITETDIMKPAQVENMKPIL